MDHPAEQTTLLTDNKDTPATSSSVLAHPVVLGRGARIKKKNNSIYNQDFIT